MDNPPRARSVCQPADVEPRLSPARLDLVLEAVAQHHPLEWPETLLGRVEGPEDRPELLGLERLWHVPPLDTSDRTGAVEDALRRLGLHGNWRTLGPDDDLPWVVPVVVRPGPCVWSWDESEVMLGLRYGLNGTRALQSEPLVVTGRGWWAPFRKVYDTSPRAHWSPYLRTAG